MGHSRCAGLSPATGAHNPLPCRLRGPERPAAAIHGFPPALRRAPTAAAGVGTFLIPADGRNAAVAFETLASRPRVCVTSLAQAAGGQQADPGFAVRCKRQRLGAAPLLVQQMTRCWLEHLWNESCRFNDMPCHADTRELYIEHDGWCSRALLLRSCEYLWLSTIRITNVNTSPPATFSGATMMCERG